MDDSKKREPVMKWRELDLEELLTIVGNGTAKDPFENLAERLPIWRHIAEDEYEH